MGSIRQVVVDGALDPKGYQRISLTTVAQGLTVPPGAHIAMIQTESQNVRYRDDDIAPTTAVGMVIYAGDSIWYNGDLTAISLIAVAGTTNVNILFYSL